MTNVNIRETRLYLGLTQQQLGEALGLPHPNARRTVGMWELGKRKPSGPTLIVMRLLASGKITVEDLR